MLINYNHLTDLRAKLEMQKAQASATVQQATGAIAIIDSLLVHLQQPEIPDNVLETPSEPKENFDVPPTD